MSIYVNIYTNKYVHGFSGVHIFRSHYVLNDQSFPTDKGGFPPWRFVGGLITPKRKNTNL
jgi:hypothetical protein